MIYPRNRHVGPLVGLAAALVATILLAGSTAAAASLECNGCESWWHLNVSAVPRDLPPDGEGKISVLAENYGDAGASAPVTLTDKLPAGLIAQSVVLGFGQDSIAYPVYGRTFCKVQPHEVTCTVPAELEGAEERETLHQPFSHIEAYITVKVAPDASSGEVDSATVSGGAPTTSASAPIVLSSTPTQFGVEQYELLPENADGSPDTQAGSHPFQLTTVIGLNQSAEVTKPPAAVKDLRFNLPPGLIGNPTPFPECRLAKFQTLLAEGQNACPDDTVVGVASVSFSFPVSGQPATFAVPLFALEPSVGEPARFAFDIDNNPIYLDTSVRSGADYGVTVTVPNITEITGFISSRVTFWGVPGDGRHDNIRGWNCMARLEHAPACVPTGEEDPPPLLTMPTACEGPVTTNVESDSWQQAGDFTAPFEYVLKDNIGRPVAMDGCNRLPFTPSVRVTPDGQAASTPTGLTVDEHVPQESDLNPTGLAESAVKGLSVVLPEGVALNPSGADGLQACSQEQIGLQSFAAASCPQAAKIATVKIKTPLLAEPLEGAAYLATQDANPFGSLVAMYVYAEAPIAGVRAKAVGEVLENPVTGQITAHFERDPVFADDPRYAAEPEADYLPEVPFEDIELHFFGGDRAPLTTPARCGAYTTAGTFTPWSGNETTESNSTFDVTSGPNGSPCESPLPFNPTLTTGTSSIQAGGFSPFVMTMSREDGEQSLQAVKLRMPPGLLGTLSTVKLCGEPQADAGTCGAESQIGETIVSVGVGGDPYTVTGGKVYITGPYEGAPYGLSIVNPAKAGPFDLGQVIVRAKVEVDPETAQLTITTDTSGAYKIPTILDGIPLEIKHVNVDINRPDFTFNPTNCNPLAVAGSLQSSEGASASLSIPFQATNCAVLAFKPKLAASTSGKTSRADGASLRVKLSYPAGPYDANIARVKVELPKALPSRLTTLQKACTAEVFDANPAGCPAASIVGHATATTPVLPVPLEGPAYFVSHGNEAFPSLIIVLQGYGVTVHLVGSTYISTKGITSSTFKTVPDVPVGTFELTLPQGPYSALTANTNLCKAKSLAMPTEFVGQNGALIKTTTKITTSGCPKATKTTRHKQHRKQGRRNKRSRARTKGARKQQKRG
jgi:hypothetical protein